MSTFNGWKVLGWSLLALGLLESGGTLQATAAEPADRTAGNLFLFVNPSAQRIHWNTPGSLLASTLRSELASKAGAASGSRETALGHVVVHFNCQDSSGESRSGWIGMTGQNDSGVDIDDLLKKQIGMGVLFKLYSDGSATGNKLSRELVALNPGRWEFDGLIPRSMESKFLRTPVSAEQCSEIWDYVSTYRERSYQGQMPLEQWEAQGPEKILYYGFPIREPYANYLRFKAGDTTVPLGGGCTAYGVSFLKLLQAHTPELENFFTRRLPISEKLIGKTDPLTGSQNKASIFDILFGKLGRHWNRSNDAIRPLDMYDPQLMWDFIDGVQSCAKKLRIANSSSANTFKKTCTPQLESWVQQHVHELSFFETMQLTSKKEDDHGIIRKTEVIRNGIGLEIR